MKKTKDSYGVLTQHGLCGFLMPALKDKGLLGFEEVQRLAANARTYHDGYFVWGNYFRQRLERLVKKKLLGKVKANNRAWYFDPAPLEGWDLSTLNDPAQRLVCADWLEERGHVRLAEDLRDVSRGKV